MNTKANFINSVTDGQKIPCPVCNTLNETDATFCASCGNKFSLSTSKQIEGISTISEEKPESISVFAQGLPSWDIVPPQIMIRRKKQR